MSCALQVMQQEMDTRLQRKPPGWGPPFPRHPCRRSAAAFPPRCQPPAPAPWAQPYPEGARIGLPPAYSPAAATAVGASAALAPSERSTAPAQRRNFNYRSSIVASGVATCGTRDESKSCTYLGTKPKRRVQTTLSISAKRSHEAASNLMGEAPTCADMGAGCSARLLPGALPALGQGGPGTDTTDGRGVLFSAGPPLGVLPTEKRPAASTDGSFAGLGPLGRPATSVRPVLSLFCVDFGLLCSKLHPTECLACCRKKTHVFNTPSFFVYAWQHPPKRATQDHQITSSSVTHP